MAPMLGAILSPCPIARLRIFPWSNIAATAQTPWATGPDAIFQYQEAPVGLFEYVRGSLSGGTYRFDPVYELKSRPGHAVPVYAGPRTLCRPSGAGRDRQEARPGLFARQHLCRGRQGMGGLCHAFARRQPEEQLCPALCGHHEVRLPRGIPARLGRRGRAQEQLAAGL